MISSNKGLTKKNQDQLKRSVQTKDQYKNRISSTKGSGGLCHSRILLGRLPSQNTNPHYLNLFSHLQSWKHHPSQTSPSKYGANVKSWHFNNESYQENSKVHNKSCYRNLNLMIYFPTTVCDGGRATGLKFTCIDSKQGPTNMDKTKACFRTDI